MIPPDEIPSYKNEICYIKYLPPEYELKLWNIAHDLNTKLFDSYDEIINVIASKDCNQYITNFVDRLNNIIEKALAYRIEYLFLCDSQFMKYLFDELFELVNAIKDNKHDTIDQIFLNIQPFYPFDVYFGDIEDILHKCFEEYYNEDQMREEIYDDIHYIFNNFIQLCQFIKMMEK